MSYIFLILTHTDASFHPDITLRSNLRLVEFDER